MTKNIDDELEEEKQKLKGSLLYFCQFFYKVINGRDYIIPQPIGRESHEITVCRALTKVFRLEYNNLQINIPPGHGKSEKLVMFMAWSFAHYPDCNFIYTSYSHELATKHTKNLKKILTSRMYQSLFDVRLRHDSKRKDSFETEAGGEVRAFGTGGAITGQNAGLPGLDRFSGALIMDDPHKPNDIHSDTIRNSVITNYEETMRQRSRGVNVPMIYIGQRLHEADLGGYFLDGKDIEPWNHVILPALDKAENALYPDKDPKEKLLALQEKQPYVFASQYQQNPQPAGGGIFKPEWFCGLDETPNIHFSFLTVDTAETAKTHNDATVFSFWGLYNIETMGRDIGMLGLHWLDTVEIWVEPKDLKDEFLNFWQECMRFQCPPKLAAIEKKSTGVTLLSVLDEIRGIELREIQRNRSSGDKTSRFLATQPYVKSRQVSYTIGARHMATCLEHMRKITANETHRYDDIADTLADAVQIALIDKTLYNLKPAKDERNNLIDELNRKAIKRRQLARKAHGPTNF